MTIAIDPNQGGVLCFPAKTLVSSASEAPRGNEPPPFHLSELQKQNLCPVIIMFVIGLFFLDLANRWKRL